MKHIALGIVCVTVIALGIKGISLIPVYAASTSTALAESEQVKIFSGSVGEMDKLEKEINAWLKENDGKIYIYSRTQSGTQFAVQVAIWYKVKK